MTRPADLKSSRFFIAHSVLVHGVLLTGILLMVLVFVPNMKKVYRSYGTDLPPMTSAVMRIGLMCRGLLAIPVVLGAVLLVGADAVWTWRLAANARLAWSFVWGFGITCLLVIGVFCVVFALLAPFM